jgi:hypothetical protein
MKKIAKKTYISPEIMVIDLPCEVLLTTSTSVIDPYAGEETIDISLDIFQLDPTGGTFDAL